MDIVRDPKSRYIIHQGDICVIFISESQKIILKIEPDQQLQTKFGVVNALDLVGRPYGVRYDCRKGWVLPLKLTSELWTELVPHRTQILYQADISMILLQLDVKPGSIVVESGTGSGSLSHAIIRACKPNGFLHTFDINQSRVKGAQEEFEDHKLSKNVKVSLRNVCELGYGEELNEAADACILDLPQTWDAIEHAYKTLKPDGSKLCTFSPCIEQVKQNVAKMTELKMKDIVTLETLIRPFEVREQNLRLWSDDVLDNLIEMDKKRIESIQSSLNTSMKRVKLTNESDCDPTTESSATNEQKMSFYPNQLDKRTIVHAKQCNETVSHSGFLTFATKRP